MGRVQANVATGEYAEAHPQQPLSREDKLR